MQEITFSVNFLFGQKHLASLLEVHLGARFSQVLMHCGTVLGHGADGAGLELVAGEVPVEPVPPVMVPAGAVEVVPAEHLVQIVDVEVRVTVETVLVGTVMVEPPVVIVLVTGQVVTVVYVIKVAVDSPGTAGVEPADTLEGTGVTGAVVTPAEHLVQMVEVEVRVTVETVLLGTVIVEPPVVIVLVTGQVVTVVYVTKVVVDSSGTAGVEPAETLEGTDPVGTGLETAGVDAAGVDSAGGVVPPGTEAAGVLSAPGTVVTPAEHLVQIVEVEVIVTVEMVLEVVTMYEEPVLIVEVTGHTVVVVYVTTVTVDSGGTDEPPAGTEALELTGEEPEGPAGEVTG